MSTEHDLYGFTPEERAAFEQWAHDDGATYLMLTCENGTGVYNNSRSHFNAEGWAACAKLNREKLEQERHLHACTLHHANDLAARIKEIEAENARLRADAERMDFLESKGYVEYGPQKTFVFEALFMGSELRGFLDNAIKAAKTDKGFCPELAKKEGFGEGSDKFWAFIGKKLKGSK